LVLAGRRVVLTLVHANARIDVRWRHLARDHALPDRAGPGARFLEGDERHRRDGIRLMALLALLLEDGGDVLREGRLARSCCGRRRRAVVSASGAPLAVVSARLIVAMPVSAMQNPGNRCRVMGPPCPGPSSDGR